MDVGFFLMVFAVLQPNDARVDPRAIIEKAVRAQGGLELLGKQGASVGKIKGTFFTDSLQFTGEFHNQGQGKLRLALQLKDQGSRVLVLNGKKGWIVFDGLIQELEEDTLGRLHKANYVDRVCGLVTLLRDKGYALTLVGEKSMNGKAVLEVKVASEGKPDVHLHFDKTAGFLVKSGHRGPEPGGGKDVWQETHYLDYQRADSSARDEKILEAAGRKTDSGALVKYLREQTPDAATRAEIEGLIRQLGDESFAVRQRASTALAKHGPRAATLLQQARRGTDIEVIRRAEKCLERLAPDIVVAGAAVRLLAVRKPADAIETLLAYFAATPDDKVARDVEDVLILLGQTTKPPHPALVKALDGRDARLRTLAAAALGKDGGAYLKQPGRRLFLKGLYLPRLTSSYIEGQKRMDLETTEQEFFNRLDDALFERPEKEPER